MAQFIRETAGVELRLIEERNANYELGDFEAPSGLSLECKGQPIDPSRYSQNFLEVFEETRNPEHAQGSADLARALRIAEDELAKATVHDHRHLPRRQTTVGILRRVSVSIHTFLRATFVIYVNTSLRIIYVYKSAELLDLIREAIRREGLHRAMGNSNQDTYSVLVSLPSMIWRSDGKDWTFEGIGTAEHSATILAAALSGPRL